MQSSWKPLFLPHLTSNQIANPAALTLKTSRIQPLRTPSTATTLVPSTVVCHLDYYITFRTGSPAWPGSLTIYSQQSSQKNLFKRKARSRHTSVPNPLMTPLPCRVKKKEKPKSSYKDPQRSALFGLLSYSLVPCSLLQPLWPSCLNTPNTLPPQGLCTLHWLFPPPGLSPPGICTAHSPVSIRPLPKGHLRGLPYLPYLK